MFKKGYIGKWDIVVIIALLLLSFASLGYWAMTHNTQGGRIRISVNGATFGEYDLDKPQVISIPNEKGEIMNEVTIANQEAYMSDADCPDQLCLKQGKISKLGQSIVCLPDRVIVTVIDGESNEVDSVVS